MKRKHELTSSSTPTLPIRQERTSSFWTSLPICRKVKNSHAWTIARQLHVRRNIYTTVLRLLVLFLFARLSSSVIFLLFVVEAVSPFAVSNVGFASGSGGYTSMSSFCRLASLLKGEGMNFIPRFADKSTRRKETRGRTASSGNELGGSKYLCQHNYRLANVPGLVGKQVSKKVK